MDQANCADFGLKSSSNIVISRYYPFYCFETNEIHQLLQNYYSKIAVKDAQNHQSNESHSAIQKPGKKSTL